jgi:hypothetical protein
VPEHSRLDSFVAHGVVDPVGADEIGTTAGRTSIGTYLLVPPGGASLDASWTAPYVAATGPDGVVTYRLVVQKQAGTLADAVHVSIAIPGGATLVDASPVLVSDGDRLTFDGHIWVDVILQVRYRLAGSSTAPPSTAPSSTAASSPAPAGASIVPSH